MLFVDAPYERIRHASKVKIYLRLSVFVSVFFRVPVNLVTFTCQRGVTNFTKLNCTNCRFKRLFVCLLN